MKGERTMDTYYHVTDVKNLDSILQNGLLPKIGPLSEQLGETGEPEPAIYLFTSKEACTDAMSSWLGEAYDELDEEAGEKSLHVVLRVELGDEEDSDEQGGEEFYEKVVYKPILPACISVCRDVMCDFDYDEDWFSCRYGDIVR